MACVYHESKEEIEEAKKKHYAGIKKTKKALDLSTRLLCELMTKLQEEEATDPFIGLGLFSPELKTWWRKHQEMDRKREAKEKAAQKKKDSTKQKKDTATKKMELAQLAKLAKKYPKKARKVR